HRGQHGDVFDLGLTVADVAERRVHAAVRVEAYDVVERLGRVREVQLECLIERAIRSDVHAASFGAVTGNRADGKEQPGVRAGSAGNSAHTNQRCGRGGSAVGQDLGVV